MTRLLKATIRHAEFISRMPDQINSFWSEDRANEVATEKSSLFLENLIYGDGKL